MVTGPGEQEIRERVIKFINSRRNPLTKEYVAKIIDRLEMARSADTDANYKKINVGWIRVKVLLDDLVGTGKPIRNATTFYRLMDDLSEDRIIERKTQSMPHEKGRKATFYRISLQFREYWFLSREQLEQGYSDYLHQVSDLSKQLLIAQDLLKMSGYPIPHQKIEEKFIERWEREPFMVVYRDENLPEGSTTITVHPPDKIYEISKQVCRYGPKKADKK